MSAYAIDRSYRCPCGRRATHEVFNTHNASQGMRCRVCAEKLVAKLKKEERSA